MVGQPISAGRVIAGKNNGVILFITDRALEHCAFNIRNARHHFLRGISGWLVPPNA